MKRFIAVLICALMLTSLLPSVAFAQEGENYSEQGMGDNLPGGENQPDGDQLTGGENQSEGEQLTGEENQSEGEQLSDENKSDEGKQSQSGEQLQNNIQDPVTFTVAAGATPQAGGSVSGAGTYEKDAQATVTAVANEGYVFVAWKENGAVLTTETTYTFTVDGDRNLFAKFEAAEQEECVIDVAATPSEGGVVTGGGTYSKGASVTVTAAANEGYKFVAWRENGAEVSADASFTFEARTNRTLVAKFEAEEQETCTITAVATPSEGGLVAGGGTYNNGDSVTLIAAANEGYKFVAWKENGAVVSTEAALTFEAATNRNLVAAFEQETQTEPAKAETTTKIKASRSKVTRGSSVTYQVTVKDAEGNSVTEGTVQLYINGEAYGKAVDVKPLISWKISASDKNKFKVGDNTVKAVYSGTEELASSEDDVAVKVTRTSSTHSKPCCGMNHHSGKCVSVRPGEDVIFKVALSCGDSCQWYVDKGDGCGFVKIKGATCANYTVKDVSSKMDGYKYRCVISNGCKTVNTPTFTLNVVYGSLSFPKTGDIGLMSPAAAMGIAALCLLKRRKDEE